MRWRALLLLAPSLPAEVQSQNKCEKMRMNKDHCGRHQSQLNLNQTSRRVKDRWWVLEIPICMEWKHSPATLMWYFGMCQDPGYSRETLKACLVLRLLLLAESDWAPRTYQEWQWSCGAEGEGQGLRSFQWTEEARIEKKTSWGRALVI